MSLYAPVNRDEVARSGWIAIGFIAGAPLLHLAVWWNVYYSSDTLVEAWAPGVILGLVLTGLTYRRTKRLVRLGLHPSLARNQRLPVGNMLAVAALMVGASWAWVLGAQALWVLPATRVEQRIFTVAVVDQCRRKCNGCHTRVRFSNWVEPGDPRICAEDLEPKVGEQLLLRGRFGERVQYLHGIGRPGS